MTRKRKGSNQPAAARRLVPLSRFPSGESRGGRGPPTQPKTAAPPTRGLRPLVNPPLYLRRELTGPAFSWKVQSHDPKEKAVRDEREKEEAGRDHPVPSGRHGRLRSPVVAFYGFVRNPQRR